MTFISKGGAHCISVRRKGVSALTPSLLVAEGGGGGMYLKYKITLSSHLPTFVLIAMCNLFN